MTEGIEIIISGRDNFSAAASSAAASIENLKKRVEQQSNAVVYANGIMNKWTESNYKAVEAGGKLADKARLLGQEVAKGNLSVAQANRQYALYEKQMKASVWQSMTLGEKLSVVRQRISAVGTSMLQMAGGAAVVGLAARQIYSFAREGARIEFVERKFNRLASAAGSTGNVFLTQLKQATRGTVSDFGLLQQGSDLLQLGLARNTDEAVRLSKVMTALGMDTGELTLALANQSKRRLDQLGLSLAKFNEIEARLKKSGMSKEDAFREAFIQTAEETIATTGNMADTNYGAFLRLEASWQNLVNDFKQGLPEMNLFGDTLIGTVEKIQMFLQGTRALQRGDTVIDWSAILGGEDVWVRQTTAMEKAVKRGRSAAEEFLDLQKLDDRARREAYYNKRDERYTAMFMRGAAMTDFYSARQTPPTEETPINYQSLMSAGLAMTHVNEGYRQSVEEINAALAEETAKLQQLEAAGYSPLSQKIIEQKAAIQELQTAAVQADDARLDSAVKTVSALLEQAGASQDVQLEFARASGQISDDAYRQAEAMNAIVDAMAQGKLTAEQGMAALQGLIENLNTLDGMSVDAYVNLYMNTFGGAHGNTLQTLQPLSNLNNLQNINSVGVTAMASGGSFDGGFAITGDTMTGLTPYSELVYAPHGGYVFNASDTRKILSSGAINPVRRPSGGWVTPLPMDDSPTLVSTALMGAFYKSKSSKGSSAGQTPKTAGEVPANVASTASATAITSEELASTSHAMTFATEKIVQNAKETNELLRQLIAKTATEGGIARAVVGEGNKWNG